MKFFHTALAIVVFAQIGMLKAEGRPKIGLVLSGGGALGVAHVGVLKALEELHIPIDYIAGTSMGAVVGGLYASGLSPEELDDWFRHADWHFLLSDSLPRESESFRKKQRQFDLNQGIAFNVSRKAAKLPGGFVSGRNVMASLRQLTVPAREIRDFDRLPIPFRAVATDIETGDLVVLRKGDFVEAMRASMSIPAIFTPQRIDGRLLADGGLANNLPISIVQQMGADVVIAVDASEQLKKEADLDSASAMANQVLTIFVQRQTREEIARLGPGDALVRLKVEDMATTDFAKAAKGIDTGYRQIMERRTSLARFSAEPEPFRQYLAGQRVPRGEPVLVSFLKVQTPEGEFEHALPQPIPFNVKDHAPFVRLQSLLGDLGELQKFDVSDYEVMSREGGTGLLVKARKKRGGPSDLTFGFQFGYSSADETDFNLLLSYRMTELNSLGAEWGTHLSLGNTTRFVTEWYQPVDWQRRFFFAAQGLFASDYINGRDADGAPLRFRLQDHVAGLDLGARLWQAGELRVGYARGFSRISRRLGVAEEVPTSVDRGSVHANLTVDTLDAPSFATRGTYGRVSLVASREELGGSDNYTRIEGQFYQPLTFGKNTIVPRASASLKVGGGDVPLYDQVPLGGFLNLSGLSRGVLFGQNAALAQLIYYRKLAELPPGLGRALYGGVSVEAGEVWADARDFDVGNAIMAGSVFLGADTSLGALYLGVGVAEGGDAAIYLQLGSLFGQGREQR
jgi:NTE family protein